ncbi:MAG: glycosyltransferase family 2 protein [Deltaproteobacteria bacterium]|nr:glycosyltransferase family 2 protein [Deltaproteobacteria bacterium]
MSIKVDILLSVYNSGLYIKELIDSLFRQTYEDWRLIIRDDCSTDNTVDIINGYLSLYSEKVILVKNNEGRLGSCHGFARLLSESTAPYIMFCDQDDKWLPEKVEKTLAAMEGLEKKYAGKPLLVHTDMMVADRRLNVISDSFWRYQHINPELKTLNRLLVLNNVTGCTMMVNSALRELSTPVAPEALMHDWWLALVASAFGHIEYLREPTMLYRQHGGNEAGAARYSLRYFIARAKNLDKSAALARRIVAQAGAFFFAYGDRLAGPDRDAAQGLSTLLEKPRAARLATLLRYGLRGYGLARSLGITALFVLMDGKSHKGAAG